jgi:hypothetical protein
MTSIKINDDEYEIYEDTFGDITFKSVNVTLHYNEESPDEAFTATIAIGAEVEDWDKATPEQKRWDEQNFYYMESLDELEDAIINGHYEFTIVGP